MIGYEPSLAKVELYYRLERLQPWEIAALLPWVGSSIDATELLEFIGEATGRPTEKELPGSAHGFSVVMGGGELGAFSFFGFARNMFGSD